MNSRHSALLREPPLPLVCAALSTSVAQTVRNENRNDTADTAWLLHAVQKVPRRV